MVLKRLGITALRDQCCRSHHGNKMAKPHEDRASTCAGWAGRRWAPSTSLSRPRLPGTLSMIWLVPAPSSGLMLPAQEAPRCHPKNQENERGQGCSPGVPVWEVTGWPSILVVMGHILRNVLQGLSRPKRKSTPASQGHPLLLPLCPP